MVRTKIRGSNAWDLYFLAEDEFNEFFGQVVITGTEGATTVQETFAQYFPGQGLLVAGSGVTVTSGATSITIASNSGVMDLSLTADSNIALYDLVYITGDNNEVAPAKSDAFATLEVVGMSIMSATTGNPVTVRAQGVVG